MRALLVSIFVAVLFSGCAVSGGGTSGTGLDFDRKCKPGQPKCCVSESDCVPAGKERKVEADKSRI